MKQQKDPNANKIAIFCVTLLVVFLLMVTVVMVQAWQEVQEKNRRRSSGASTYSTRTYTPRPSTTYRVTATPRPTATPRATARPKATVRPSDPYDAGDYTHPDDFYYDHPDDFYDYEDAEEYWEEYG